jgi:predicted nucleotidyltransferase
MRITRNQASFLKQAIQSAMPGAAIYLFGSRARDDRKGGDIDILVLGDRELANQEKRNIKIEFYKKFGQQKIDIVSFEKEDPSPFKEIALLEGVRL